MRVSRYLLLMYVTFCTVYSCCSQTVADTAAKNGLNPEGFQRLSGIALDTLTGSFFKSSRFYSIVYILEKAGAFREAEYSCMGNYDLDKGRWKIKGKNKIELLSGRTRKHFVMYRFKELLFLVPSDSAKQFEEDFHKTLCRYNEVENGTPVSLSEDSLFVAYLLSRTYFTRFPGQ